MLALKSPFFISGLVSAALGAMLASSAHSASFASELPACFAQFVRPHTRIEVELPTMKPRPDCPTNMLVNHVNQVATALLAGGAPKPILGGTSLTEDSSGTAPFLALWVLRFDSPVSDGDALSWGAAVFGEAPTDLHFVAHRIGDRPADVRGFSAGDSLLVKIQGATVTQLRDRFSGNGGRELICLSAVTRPATTVAVVCRSTTLARRIDKACCNACSTTI